MGESGWLASKRRGAVHLLTGKNIDGSVIGMAYMDVMCESIPGDAWNGKYEYGISKATHPFLGCNVGLVMQELGRNAGSSHYLGCSTTFHPLAIGQIEDHMDGHVPNDGRTDGCWCEKMFYWPGGWPWWWKFPWVYWGPFMPADLPPKELPPKDLLPEEPLPEEPLPEKPHIKTIDGVNPGGWLDGAQGSSEWDEDLQAIDDVTGDYVHDPFIDDVTGDYVAQPDDSD